MRRVARLGHHSEEEICLLKIGKLCMRLPAGQIWRQQLELFGRWGARAQLLYVLRLDDVLIESQNAIAQLIVCLLELCERNLDLIRTLQVQ